MKYKVLLILLTFLCCSKEDTEILTYAELKGKWIETETRLDTLYFESMENLEILNLNRGKEIRNGILMPKYGSGPYNYNLFGEKISLNWLLSSDSNYNDYYFKINGNKLNIGNFYGSTSSETLIFERLD